MAYTVKQVAAMSGVSRRTLHFYDETGLLKPARHGSNGYRYYEEAQLLRLQQILFYRELGFDLKQIKDVLGRAGFETVAALESHRAVLREKTARTRALIATIDHTIQHLRGEKPMQSEEMFAGFSVAAGKARFEEEVRLGGEPIDCKVSGEDTGGTMCVFEFTGRGGGPRHKHAEQDEWIYVLEGGIAVEVGTRRFVLGAGESVFLPRGVPHGWASMTDGTARVLNTYQPAGKMEEFFRELARHKEKLVHEALSFDELCLLFREHGLEVTGPPLLGEWKVDEERRIVQIA